MGEDVMSAPFHGTTILAVKRDGHVTMAGDGQVTLGQSMVMKHTARKIRLVGDGKVLAPRPMPLPSSSSSRPSSRNFTATSSVPPWK